MSVTIAAGLLLTGQFREATIFAREPSESRALPMVRDHDGAAATQLFRSASDRGAVDDVGAAAGTEAEGAIAHVSHIRIEDVELQRLLVHGRHRSGLLNTLVKRLEASDVVVYVRCDPRLRRDAAGRLTFVGMAARLRYVMVRVGCTGDRLSQIALLGHELRHAVEVADTPAIVDSRSLQTAYERIGYVNRRASVHGVIAFESDQAIEAGERILRELHDGTN